MKILPIALLITFGLSGLGCEGGLFGCGKKEREIDLKLGTPGLTDVQNNLPSNDNVKTLDEDESIEFTTDSGEAIITHHLDREIHPGDVLVANSEQRYLVRVHEVIQRESGRTQAVLRQARIGDVVGDESGSLKIESTPVYDLEDIDRINRLAKQRAGDDVVYEADNQGRVIIRNLELFSIDLNSDGSFSGGANKILGIPVKNPYEKFTISSGVGGKYRAVINEATIEVVPTLRSDSKWSEGKISHLETRMDTKVKYRIDMTYEAAGMIQVEALIDAFMPKKVIPFRVPGPTPVYLDIELGIPAGAALKATTSGKTRVIFESEYQFYTTMNYDHTTGITSEKDQKVSIMDKRIETKEGDVKLEAELFLKPQITARLYRVVGPYAYLKPYVRGEVEWPSVEQKDDLFIGVTGGVGIELSEPIFLSSMVSYDTGKLFDWSTSFDLDNKGTPPVAPIPVGQNIRTTVTVDKIGPEGFVSLKLKEHLDDGFLRYQLINATQTGLLVPSETFYMDGELFYYPLPHSTEESFVVRIFGKNNSHEDVSIAIKVSGDVSAQVSQDRFGMTTNSYKVASGTPGEFKGQVPSHDLGGAIGIATASPLELSECLKSYDINSGRSSRNFYGDCSQFEPLAIAWLNSLGASINGGDGEAEEQESQIEEVTFPTVNVKNSEKFTKIKQIQNLTDRALYQYYDLTSFNYFVANHSARELNCYPSLEVKVVEDQGTIGLRLVTNGCEGLIAPLAFNTNYFSQPFSRASKSSVKWGNKKVKGSETLSITEITFSKKDLHRFEGGIDWQDRLYILLPFGGDVENFLVTNNPGKHVFYSQESMRITNIPFFRANFKNANGYAKYQNVSSYNNASNVRSPYSGKAIELNLSLFREDGEAPPRMEIQTKPVLLGKELQSVF